MVTLIFSSYSVKGSTLKAIDLLNNFSISEGYLIFCLTVA